MFVHLPLSQQILLVLHKCIRTVLATLHALHSPLFTVVLGLIRARADTFRILYGALQQNAEKMLLPDEAQLYSAAIARTITFITC